MEDVTLKVPATECKWCPIHLRRCIKSTDPESGPILQVSVIDSAVEFTRFHRLPQPCLQGREILLQCLTSDNSYYGHFVARTIQSSPNYLGSSGVFEHVDNNEACTYSKIIIVISCVCNQNGTATGLISSTSIFFCS